MTSFRYELRFEGAAEVQRALWHYHDGGQLHWHTAEQYARHPDAKHEVCLDGDAPDDLSGTEH